MNKKPAAKKPAAKKTEAEKSAPPLRDRLVAANKEILAKPLNRFGKPHISAIDRNTDIVWFKAADLSLSVNNLIGVYLRNGRRTHERGTLPLDAKLHLALYKRFPQINSIAHFYADNITSFSQAGADIPVTTSDQQLAFGGPVKCCEGIYEGDEASEYKLKDEAAASILGKGTVFPSGGLLLHYDGAIVWNASPKQTINTAASLEGIARLAWSRMIQDRKNKVFGNEDES